MGSKNQTRARYTKAMKEINSKAPDFSLTGQDDAVHSISDFKGQYVLLYFYPKDDTPGCTKEACALKEVYEDFKTLGIAVIGISADSPESHKKFADKYGLPFYLLSDKNREIIREYGAEKSPGTKRISYLINPEGVIIKVYPQVDPATHAVQILKDVREMIK